MPEVLARGTERREQASPERPPSPGGSPADPSGSPAASSGSAAASSGSAADPLRALLGSLSLSGAAWPGVVARVRRVLVVEDDDAIRDELSSLLGEEGYEVAQARDGVTALRALREGPAPDLIVLDLRLPLLDGWELRVQLRADPALAAIPVIAISADLSPKAQAVHAERFLQKPFSGDALLAAVREVLTQAERAQVEAALAHTDRLASLGRLAAGVVHEVRNPLTYLLANLELIGIGLERSGLAASQRQDLLGALAQAREGVEAIARITRDLSDFSKAPGAWTGARVDLIAAAEAALRMARPQLPPRARLEQDLAPVPPVAGDAGRVVQVLLNLLLNAGQALDPQRPGEVRLATRRSAAGEVICEVRDTGSGIRPEDRERIFEPFVTSKGQGGTGLGLAVCKRIVTELGGRIEVESELGRGSAFRVVLPSLE
ncbi:MAG: sensor histidine kinase [Planctomycetota bacterium]